MSGAQETISQAKFAELMGVSRAAVSQWKGNDILTEAAFTKPGKTGKLILDVAKHEALTRRDVGQSLGNGIDTGAETAQPAEPSPPQPAPQVENPPAQPELPSQSEPVREIEPPVTVEAKLKEARLEEQMRRNRLGAIEEARDQGRLMESAEARAQMRLIALHVMQVFEGGINDLAKGLAGEFGLTERDVQHNVRATLRKLRASAEDKNRLTLRSIEATREVELEEG